MKRSGKLVVSPRGVITDFDRFKDVRAKLTKFNLQGIFKGELQQTIKEHF